MGVKPGSRQGNGTPCETGSLVSGVATVNSSGYVTASSAGSAKINASTIGLTYTWTQFEGCYSTGIRFKTAGQRTCRNRSSSWYYTVSAVSIVARPAMRALRWVIS
jgi:hypothetical protein